MDVPNNRHMVTFKSLAVGFAVALTAWLLVEDSSASAPESLVRRAGAPVDNAFLGEGMSDGIADMGAELIGAFDPLLEAPRSVESIPPNQDEPACSVTGQIEAGGDEPANCSTGAPGSQISTKCSTFMRAPANRKIEECSVITPIGDGVTGVHCSVQTPTGGGGKPKVQGECSSLVPSQATALCSVKGADPTNDATKKGRGFKCSVFTAKWGGTSFCSVEGATARQNPKQTNFCSVAQPALVPKKASARPSICSVIAGVTGDTDLPAAGNCSAQATTAKEAFCSVTVTPNSNEGFCSVLKNSVTKSSRKDGSGKATCTAIMGINANDDKHVCSTRGDPGKRSARKGCSVILSDERGNPTSAKVPGRQNDERGTTSQTKKNIRCTVPPEKAK
jgi:hypothetical protein